MENYVQLTPIQSLLRFHQEHPPKLAFCATTNDEFEQWQLKLRAKLRELSGLDIMSTEWKCDLLVKEEEAVDYEDYTQQKLYLQTAPDYWMPVYVLRPKGAGPFIPMIALHGHDGVLGGRGAIGLARNQDEKAIIQHRNCAYGLEAVRKGYIVFAPDKRGFGERTDAVNVCKHLATAAIVLGMSEIGMHTWDNMRLLDYIEKRSDCQVGLAGCIGLSGGGGGTLWLAAMDTRISAAVISGHLASFQGNDGKFACVCNAVPNVLTWADRGDIAGLIAPRALLVESASNDKCFSRTATLDAFKTVEHVYKVAGIPEKINIDLFEGYHEWSGRKAWNFLAKYLINQ